MAQAFVTKPAPDFKVEALLNGTEFGEVKLSDYRGKYLVVMFYPLDWTFVCPTEILAFNDRVDEFRKIGCEVIVGSTDSVFSHHAWANHPRKEGGLKPMKVPMFADMTHAMSKAYGVFVEDDGFDLRGTFIIDDKGILRQMSINDRPVGRSVDEVLRLVNAFQYTDKHGEVCPAGWNPGSATMIPDPEKKLAYFKAQ